MDGAEEGGRLPGIQFTGRARNVFEGSNHSIQLSATVTNLVSVWEEFKEQQDYLSSSARH